MATFSQLFLDEAVSVLRVLDTAEIEQVALGLAAIREGGGRLFVLGVGGSAAHASHAASDFRKLCAFECYAPSDNVSELTARTNDEGWDSVFSGWLQASRLSAQDALLVLSVGGGDRHRQVSSNLVGAVEMAIATGAAVFGVVGRDGGYTRLRGTTILIPPLFADHVTPHTEGLCSVVCHLLVSHPRLSRGMARWESLAEGM